jgi:hypothetical protein
MGGAAVEDSSRLSLGVSPATAPYSPTTHADEWGLSPSVRNDLNIARLSRANTLLIGREQRVAGLVNLLVSERGAGAVIRGEDGRLFLPPPTAHVPTATIRDVESLTRDEQRLLLKWLESAGGTQVIATASTPLLPLVEAHAFHDALYYRLNTVYINLAD